MNISSTEFLFLFLPIAVGIYYVIPKKDGLRLRNIFLVIVSLFFYAWGEPLFVIALMVLVISTWKLGEKAKKQKGTAAGKRAIAVSVIINVLTIIFCGKFNYIENVLEHWTGKELAYQIEDLPLGLSFFAFFSISYVVDNYRGKCKTRNTVLNTALYTCSFFNITAGPIITYGEFEKQIENRTESLDLFAEGVWRFSLGLGKKMIIAENLSFIVNHTIAAGSSSTTLLDAWLGCIAFLVYLYFDFSGYSDMAIGLGKMFGFSLPENFNYPYISTSVSEFWRRFHITLCAWFTEYLYYPIILGPSVRLRKFLMRLNVRSSVAKTIQGTFALASVWLVTAIWHGANLNYLIWGAANCSAMLIESRIGQTKDNKIDKALRRIGFLVFLFLSAPLISIDSIGNTFSYYQSMFAGKIEFSQTAIFLLKTYWPFLIVGVLGCFPIVPYVKNKVYSRLGKKCQIICEISSVVIMLIIVILSLAYLFRIGTPMFLYQQ